MKIKGWLLVFGTLITISGFSQNKSLDYFLNQAMSSSPLLKDYQNQIQSGEYDSLLVRAAYKPQVTGTSYAVYPPIINGYGYDAAITNGGTYTALVGVNKILLNKKNVNTQLENLQLQNQSVSNATKISEQDLKRSIAAQYITVYGDGLQLDFNNTLAALLIKEEAILKKLTEKNVYKQVDYLTFLVTLQQQQLLIKQLVIQSKNDCATLNYLSGITDTATVVLDDPNISLYALPDIVNSVFFKHFEIDSLKLMNSKALININYRPKINLFADAGYNSTLAYDAYKNFGMSVGISAVIPIYDGRQRKLQYSKITIAERTRQDYKSFFTDQYYQQVSQLTQQLNATNSLINDMKNQLKYSQSLIDVNEKLLEAGEVRITDYIVALNNYLNAQNLITQNKITRLQIINQLNYWSR